jgi:carbon starvation protein CstA
VNSDDEVPVIKDRILYWPTILAVVCCLLSLMGAGELLEGEVGPGRLFTFALPLLIAGVALMVCTVWIFHRTWRRLLSTLILPISVVLTITFTGGW